MPTCTPSWQERALVEESRRVVEREGGDGTEGKQNVAATG